MSIAPLTVYHIHSLTLSPSPAIRLESLHIVGQILKIKILDAQNQNALFSIIFPCSGSYMRVIIDELVFCCCSIQLGTSVAVATLSVLNLHSLDKTVFYDIAFNIIKRQG